MRYIFNKNHNRTHYPDCSAVSMMNRTKNEVPTDEIQGYSCKWCKPGLDNQEKSVQSDLNPHIGETICTDPKIRSIFKKVGCAICHSTLGDARMYPHNPNGIKVEGRDGNWWVYFHCYECGYDTALWKAIHELDCIERGIKESEVEAK